METFDIIVYECQHVYSYTNVSFDEVVDEFVNKYETYMDVNCVKQADIDVNVGKFFVSYADTSAFADKPIILILMGNLTEHLIDTIQEKINKFYK